MTWLREARPEGTAIRVEEPFTPRFYVRASRERLDRLRAELPLLPGVGEPRLVERLCALEERPSEVLEVPVRRHERLHAIATQVDAWGECREHELFDVDLRLSHRYFLEKGLFPFAKVRAFAPGRYRLRDDQWAVDFEPPPLRLARLEAWGPGGRRLLTEDDPVGRVRLGSETLEGSEEALLEELARRVRESDPDVVVTRGGDAFLLPHLARRARAHGIAEWGLGRDGSPPVATRKSRTFHSYGQVHHRAGTVVLRGRIHLDLDETALCQDESIDGLVEQARITSTPLQELHRLTTGSAFSAMQVDAAKRERRLIPFRKNFPETLKNGLTYLLADRGALQWDPRVGAHGDVHEFDFSSFFPHLMIHRNLSPETVLCACCDPHDPAYPPDLIVPRVGYHVCRRREGINGRTLRALVARRMEYKARRRTRPEELEKWQTRSDLLKMELVCSFGYQGHKNHRHGRIEVHESINAWARHDLERSAEIARDAGFEILHALADNLFLHRLSSHADPEEVRRRVEAEVGVPFEYQGRFKWLVLLPNKTSDAPGADPVGALTRFYGCFEGEVLPTRSNGNQKLDYLAGGRLKVRGVELRQHSTPPVVRRVQEAILLRLAEADDVDALRAAVPHALAQARPLLDRIRRGDVPLEDLVVRNHVARAWDDYRVQTLAASAVKLLRDHGVETPAGSDVSYVVLDRRAKEPRHRVVETRLLRGDETYDPEHYLTLARRAIASLLLPFGWTEERLRDAEGRTRQATL